MMKTQKIPKHLQKYVVNQEYDQYSSIDQAVWRFVMRQNKHFLQNTAHEAYSKGLESSVISIDKIPNVDEEMNETLSEIGWGAVNIDGFIPGVVFFDFQAHGLLPIASDIRKLENIQYTPAPDIIHEAAGHAPILYNETFSRYVKLFGEIGSKALATKEEHEVFEATRDYSNLLESGIASATEISNAKRVMEQKQSQVTGLSEAEEISRLYWWTVEYGLVGSITNPKIYGAGLLSSVSEGRNSLTDQVEKIPFALQKVISSSFDITKPQPQLFVSEDFAELIHAVKEFSETMAWKQGGTKSLEKAIQSARTATIVYSSGLQVTGTLSSITKNIQGEAIYMKTDGKTSLNSNNVELFGHSVATHTDGFGSPIGGLRDFVKPLEQWSDNELSRAGIVLNQFCELHFASGIIVKGIPVDMVRDKEIIQLISFTNCTVNYKEEVLFQESWGQYDMAVGSEIISVFAGAADSEAFFADEVVELNSKVRELQPSPIENMYSRVRQLRENAEYVVELEEVLPDLIDELTEVSADDWLLRIEILELLLKNDLLPNKQAELFSQLEAIRDLKDEYKELIDRGLMIIDSE
ncbi:aromatic amino acid hydroxylase [Bacillus sp. 2205SS5-2]|uniref:aromatic amino acid hydroxylase n=1 Tax=Bacillus sp. 2205SS5-2 TaxID=3109031 RepID=UPI003004241D